MYRLVRGKSAFLVLVSLLVLPGCGDHADNTIVSGKVAYRSQPLVDGSVTFYPQTGHPISAGIDSAGAYNVELPPGEYRVAIQAPGAEVPKGWKEGDQEPPPPKLVLPPRYSQRARTELRITVPEGAGPQSENFDLK